MFSPSFYFDLMCYINYDYFKEFRMRNILFVFLIVFISTSLYAQNKGEDKIKEMKDRVQNTTTTTNDHVVQDEDKKPKNEHNSQKKDPDNKKIKDKDHSQEHQSDHSDDDDHKDSLGAMLFRAIFRIMFEAMAHVRYMDYPYAWEDESHYSAFIDYDDPEYKKDFRRVILFNLNLDSGYFGDGILGLQNRLMFNVSGLHFNINQQTFWSGQESFSSLSYNIGLNLSIYNFQLSGFIGGFNIFWPGYSRSMLDIGFSTMIFLPARFWLDYYLHYASQDGLSFRLMNLTLNYSLSRFTLGVGYSFYDYAGIDFQGPIIRLSLWF